MRKLEKGGERKKKERKSTCTLKPSMDENFL